MMQLRSLTQVNDRILFAMQPHQKLLCVHDSHPDMKFHCCWCRLDLAKFYIPLKHITRQLGYESLQAIDSIDNNSLFKQRISITHAKKQNKGKTCPSKDKHKNTTKLWFSCLLLPQPSPSPLARSAARHSWWTPYKMPLSFTHFFTFTEIIISRKAAPIKSS